MKKMEHTQAAETLAEYAAGQLTTDQASQVEAHLADCQDCREWLATYQVFSFGMGGNRSSQQHLDSHELAQFSLDRSQLSAVVQELCNVHLQYCSECAQEVEYVRLAALERFETTKFVDRLRGGMQAVGVSQRVLALAATLLIAIGGFVATSHWSPSASDEYRIARLSSLANRSTTTDDLVQLELTKVENGSVLNLESPVVVFGNGFSVGSGSVLTVSNSTENGSRDTLK